MQEEIKEILDKLLKYLKESNINDFGYEKDKLISYEEAQILLNYITNLQEENEKLKIEYRRLADEDAWGIADYKSRNEKAIKFIEQKLLPSHSIKNTNWEFEEVIYSDLPVEAIKPLADILQGVDKE